MSTEVQICNIALALLGIDNPILSLDDDSKEARLCKTSYPVIRDELLENHFWRFAMKRSSLTRITAPPEWRYTYKYQLPSDLVGSRLKMTDLGKEQNYKIEGGLLLTDDASVSILYVSKEIDVGKYSPAFKQAVSYALAAQLAYSMVQSSTHMQRMLSAAEDKLRAARSIDSQADYLEDLMDNSFIDARLGGRY